MSTPKSRPFKHRFDAETFTPSDLGFSDEEAKEFLDGCNFLFSHDDEQIHADQEGGQTERATGTDRPDGPPLAKLDKTHAQGPLAL